MIRAHWIPLSGPKSELSSVGLLFYFPFMPIDLSSNLHHLLLFSCLFVSTTVRSTLNKILVTISNVATKQKSNKLKDMMEKTEIIFKGFRIQPDSKVHVVWDIVALLAIMYYSISCPVRLASYIGSNSLRSSYDLLFVLDYAIDFLFLADMVLRLRVYAYVSYANGRNEVIMDRKQIQSHYIRSEWFAVDLFASIPWDVVSIGTGYYTLYRLPKVVRIWQISALISRLQKNLDECLQRTMNETQLSSLIMFLYSLLIIVWSSAGWAGPEQDGVQIFAPDGDKIGAIHLPEGVSNLCFGGLKRNRLFMTGGQSIYSLYVDVQGMPYS